MIDVRRLRVLLAVVETGSVSGAAAALSFTPSAVSQHVSALERETGTVLFERAGRGIRPTEAGLLLCEHARSVMGALQDAEDALSALRAGQVGRLRLGAFPTAGSSLVPSALAAFRSEHPNVELDLVVAEADEATAGLRSGSLDVAVTIRRHAPGEHDEDDVDDGIVHEHLLSDPFRVVLARGHRLANRRSVDLRELSADPWVTITSSPGYCQAAVDAVCAQAGFKPTCPLEADEYPTALGFVAAGLGVALVPQLALGAIHPGVVTRPVKGARPAREVWVSSRRAVEGLVAARSMRRCLRDAADRLAEAAAASVSAAAAPAVSVSATATGAG